VQRVLDEIGAGEIPQLVVFNKSDLADDAAAIAGRHQGSLAISARTGAGIDDLLVTIGDRLRALTSVVELAIPFDRGDIVASVHRDGEVLDEDAGEGGIRMRARLDDSAASRLHEFVVAPIA
jgi:GTP-binding protein HflX